MRLLEPLVRHPLLALAGLALLVLLLVLVMRWLIGRARDAGSSAPTATDLQAGSGELTYVDLRSESDPGAVQRSFRRAVRLLRRAATSGDLYRTPWFLLVGQTGAGKTTVLGHTGLTLPFGVPPEAAAQSPRPGINWWIFKPGVVLDVLGSYVLRLDGQSSDDEGWLTVLSELRRSRPRRPLDGVVVAVPADVLLAPPASGGRAANAAQQAQSAAAVAAGHVYSKLLQTELILGMRLPVDVLVTQSDLIPGFSAFAAALPARFRRQIFGWSNPQTLDSPYQTAWVGEAYAAIAQRLAELGAQGPPPAEAGAGAVEGFAAGLAATEPVVQVYADQLFASAALGEPLYFRGLYFCGGTFPTPEDGEESACCDGPQEVLFVHDLFADKVVHENAIAQPTAEATSLRKQSRRRLQLLSLAAAVLGGLALGWGYRSVENDARALKPLVETLGTAPTATGGASAEEADAWVRAVLAGSRDVEHYQPRSLFLPLSWASPLHGQVRAVFDRSYGGAVLPAAKNALESRLRDLERRRPPPPPPGPADAIEAVDETPRFEHLADQVAGVTGLELAADGYSCIGVGCAGERGLVRRFGDVTRYLYGTALDLPNREAESFYGRVLRRQSFAAWVYEPDDATALQAKTRELAGALYEQLFEDNPLLACLDRLVAKLDGLEVPVGTASTASVEAYRQLDTEIRLAAWLLAQPQLAWMGTEPLDLGAAIDGVYEAIARSRYLGPELRQELEADAESGFRRLRARLAGYSTQATGPVLASKDSEVQLDLGPGVLEVQKAVEAYLDEPFLEPGKATMLTLPRDWQRLTWDTRLLQQAADLVAPYVSYVEKDLASFPADMRSTAEEVALESLERSMMELIARAQQFEVGPEASTLVVPPQLLEADLAADAASFQQASPILAQILGDFLSLELLGSYVELAAVIDRQGYQLLADNSRLLEREDLYSPQGGGFAGWDGLTPPAPAAFGATDAKSLAGYLSQELAIITRLAQTYAQPVIDAAAKEEALRERSPEYQAELDRWSGIMNDLAEQKSQKAGNAVTELQTFIGTDLSQVTLRSCFAEPVPSAGAPPSTSYFDERQEKLETALNAQCEGLAQRYGYACYRRMAEVFNDRLAGRFPFRAGDTVPGLAEAEPAALTDFFGLYDDFAWLLAEVPPSAGLFGGENTEVSEFVSQAADVRSFLAPFLDDPKTNPVPSWDFTVGFRVTPPANPGAEDVIGWTLTVGESSFNRGDASLTGSWTYGTAPSAIALRWADDAPVVPVGTSSGDVARIEDRTVIYQYDDPWSLVALLLDHRVPSTPGIEPETLRFTIQTAPAPVGKQEGEGKKSATEGEPAAKGKADANAPPAPGPSGQAEADLFVRISLTTPDGKQPILLPAAFPAVAPTVLARSDWQSCPEGLGEE